MGINHIYGSINIFSSSIAQMILSRGFPISKSDTALVAQRAVAMVNSEKNLVGHDTKMTLRMEGLRACDAVSANLIGSA